MRANETGLKIPHREFNLAWRIAGFVVALALIAIASYFIAGAAGYWARQEWAMNVDGTCPETQSRT